MSIGLAGAAAFAFLVSLLFTAIMIRLAPRIGFVDKPGGRKIHANPKPLGGGVGITFGFVLPVLLGLMAVHLMPGRIAGWIDASLEPAALIEGVRHQTPLALAFVGGSLLLHVLGLFDDRKPLGPYSKLVLQLAAAAIVVLPFDDVRILTALDARLGIPHLSAVITIFWIGLITNAFNFLDNMDGLSAGVAAICATALLVTAALVGQWFVAATLVCLVGSLLGFLVFNFPPARIFMGDAGSLVIGFALGVLSVRVTFVQTPGDFAAGWYGVLAPLLALALPLYDLLVVSAIRIVNGKSPFVGDKNHFSHRLVNRGMSRRTAVLCLYLVTAATSIAAVILPGVRSGLAAFLLVAQTLLVLGVVMLLEQHPLPKNDS